MGPVILLLVVFSNQVSASTTGAQAAPTAQSCPLAKCTIDLINGQARLETDQYRLKCHGCSRVLIWQVSDWLAAKLQSGALEGVEVVRVAGKPTSASPLMAFDGALNNVQHLVLTAYVKGLEPLLPTVSEDWGYKVQQRLFQVYGLINFTLADSVIQGLAPLVASYPPGDQDGLVLLNPAVPRPTESATDVERAAREAKWANYVRVQNCTFSNTDLAVVGQSSGYLDLTTPIVEATGHACMLRLGAMYNVFWPGHVEIFNTTFNNITTSVPPGSGLRLHMLCIDPGDHNDTVTMRDSTFSNIKDALGDSLDLIRTYMVYTGRTMTKVLTMQRCQFVNIKAALLAALEVRELVLDNCTVNGAKLAYGGFAVMSSYSQTAEFTNSKFFNIQLGSASDATAFNQEYYNPGVGLVKTGSRAQAHVQGCAFRNVTLLPPASQRVHLANKPKQSASSAAFIRTAVIAAGADARVAQSTFSDCFTPAVVYAFSGETETLGRVYSMGTANRGAREATVSLVLHESAFVRNMYGVYADGFQVIVYNCSFTDSIVSGMRISGVPCLVMNRTKLHRAPISVQRASNPGGAAFSFCRMGWFPFWLNDKVQAAAYPDVPATARAAAVLHNISGRLTDTFDSPVSVYMDSVNISGAQGQPALSLRDIHKASLQRVNIFGSVGRGALQASSVSGLLLLQCRVENNSAGLAAGALDVAGGGTFTAVHNLYFLETLFAGNVGPEAGAMLLQSCGPVVLNSCTYHNNTAGQSGGAVRAIASESIAVDTSTLQQPENISCMQTDVLDVMYDREFVLDLTATSRGEVACPKTLLGGRATTFSSNVAGASGGAVAIEGLTLAAFRATHVNFLDNRANVSGGAVAVLGAKQLAIWSLSNAALLHNSAGGSGGALAFTVPVQGVLCQHCRLQGNTAGLLGGALFSTAHELCVTSSNQQDCLGANITFVNNTALSGGDNAYLADAKATRIAADSGTRRAGHTQSAPKAMQQGRGQCTRQDLNKTGGALRVAGPPCALVMWSPAAGTLLPYVNNGSGLPTINATVVDCWCSTVQQLPGAASSASLIPLTARLVYNNIVLFEKAVGPDGSVVFDKVDFNQPPQQYNLTLQLSPATESALAADVPKPLPVNLTVQARPCTTGEELGRDGRCRECSSGTYGRNGQCLQCKQGARCPGGALLLPQEGWWHSAPTSDVFIPCLQPEACRGLRGQLQDYQQQHYDTLERATTHRALLADEEPEYQSAVCSEGYAGHLCSTCGPNRSRTRSYHCETCTSGGRVIWVAILGTVLGVSYLWFVSASTIKDTQQPWGTLKVSDVTFCLTWFLQLLFVLATVPVTWPPTIAWLPKTAETMLSSFSSSTSSLACLLKPSKSLPSVAGQMMIIQMCLMVVLPGMVVLLELLAAACKPAVSNLRACLSARRARRGAMPPRRTAATATTLNVKQRVIITVLSCLLFFFPTILQTTMSLFVCKTLDPAGGSELVYQAQSKHGWWMSDLDIKCYGGWHAGFALAFGLPCLLLLCLGIPLVAAAVPIWAWKRNQLQEDQYRETYGFLHCRYRDDRWYYSIVQRSWLLVLVVGVVFTSGDTMLQLFVYEAVLMASLVCLTVFNPVNSPIAGRLDVCVNLAALLNGFAAVFCVASSTDSAAITGSSFGVGASGRVGLGVVVVVTNGVLLLSILAFIFKVHVATSPWVGRVVDKVRTWGTGLVQMFRWHHDGNQTRSRAAWWPTKAPEGRGTLGLC